MLGCPSVPRVGLRFRRGLTRGSRCLIALALGAGATSAGGCFPEQALSSYMDGAPPNSSVVTSTSSSRADAGPPPSVDVDAAAPPAPPPQIPDTLDASPPDAALELPLTCRGECTCETRASVSFMFCAEVVTQAVASERCTAAGGSLVSVDDEGIGSWLSERMQALDADDFWLSGTDTGEEGVWRWGDGRVFFGGDAGAGRFVPWDEGQPNDVNGEDCMRATAGVWRDLDCAEEIAYVCQG